tara:strand:+ start:1471 stop:1908 length:438 start_codon:yes stop_codon:yes gene_type:complete
MSTTFRNATKLDASNRTDMQSEISRDSITEDGGNPIEALKGLIKELQDKHEELVKLLTPHPEDGSHTKAELQDWLDARGISYGSGDLKADLLGKLNRTRSEDGGLSFSVKWAAGGRGQSDKITLVIIDESTGNRFETSPLDLTRI